MSSPNNHRQSLPPTVRHRSLEREQYHQQGTICTDAVRNVFPSIDQRFTTPRAADRVTNQFQQLQQIYTDALRASTQPITTADRSALMLNNRLEHESVAEGRLTERLKEIINEFMTRRGRRINYNNTLHWTIDHGNEINYSVVISINQPYQII